MSTFQLVCPHCMKINRLPRKEHYKKAICGKCGNSLLENRVIETDADGFNYLIQNSELPVVVDFWAPWCGPCKMMAPAFKEAAANMPLKAQFAKINTENYPQLGSMYNIRSIPTMILFVNGAERDRISGALSSTQITEWVKRCI